MELAPAVGADHQTGEQSLPLRLGHAALVLAKFLHPVPLFFRHNGLLGIRQDEHIFQGVGNALLEFVGLGVGFEITGAAGVLHPFQDVDHGLLNPVAGALRQRLSLLLGIEGLDRQHLVCLQDTGNPGWANSGNGQVKNTLDHWCGVLVQYPVVFVLRVGAVAVGRTAQVLAAGSLCFHNGTNLFAGIFGIKIVKNIANYGKIVVSFGAVHRIVDGDESHIVAGKDDFRKPADLQIVSAKSAHVLNNPSANQTLLHQGKPLLDPRAVEVRPGVPVVHQHLGIRETVGSGVAAEDVSLICNRV